MCARGGSRAAIIRLGRDPCSGAASETAASLSTRLLAGGLSLRLRLGLRGLGLGVLGLRGLGLDLHVVHFRCRRMLGVATATTTVAAVTSMAEANAASTAASTASTAMAAKARESNDAPLRNAKHLMSATHKRATRSAPEATSLAPKALVEKHEHAETQTEGAAREHVACPLAASPDHTG